jgi:hypothetical protein
VLGVTVICSLVAMRHPFWRWLDVYNVVCHPWLLSLVYACVSWSVPVAANSHARCYVGLLLLCCYICNRGAWWSMFWWHLSPLLSEYGLLDWSWPSTDTGLWAGKYVCCWLEAVFCWLAAGLILVLPPTPTVFCKVHCRLWYAVMGSLGCCC